MSQTYQIKIILCADAYTSVPGDDCTTVLPQDKIFPLPFLRVFYAALPKGTCYLITIYGLYFSHQSTYYSFNSCLASVLQLFMYYVLLDSCPLTYKVNYRSRFGRINQLFKRVFISRIKSVINYLLRCSYHLLYIGFVWKVTITIFMPQVGFKPPFAESTDLMNEKRNALTNQAVVAGLSCDLMIVIYL